MVEEIKEMVHTMDLSEIQKKVLVVECIWQASSKAVSISISFFYIASNCLIKCLKTDNITDNINTYWAILQDIIVKCLEQNEASLTQYFSSILEKSIDGTHLAILLKVCLFNDNTKSFILKRFIEMSKSKIQMNIANFPSLLQDVCAEYFEWIKTLEDDNNKTIARNTMEGIKAKESWALLSTDILMTYECKFFGFGTLKKEKTPIIIIPYKQKGIEKKTVLISYCQLLRQLTKLTYEWRGSSQRICTRPIGVCFESGKEALVLKGYPNAVPLSVSIGLESTTSAEKITPKIKKLGFIEKIDIMQQLTELMHTLHTRETPRLLIKLTAAHLIYYDGKLQLADLSCSVPVGEPVVISAEEKNEYVEVPPESENHIGVPFVYTRAFDVFLFGSMFRGIISKNNNTAEFIKLLTKYCLKNPDKRPTFNEIKKDFPIWNQNALHEAVSGHEGLIQVWGTNTKLTLSTLLKGIGSHIFNFSFFSSSSLYGNFIKLVQIMLGLKKKSNSYDTNHVKLSTFRAFLRIYGDLEDSNYIPLMLSRFAVPGYEGICNQEIINQTLNTHGPKSYIIWHLIDGDDYFNVLSYHDPSGEICNLPVSSNTNVTSLVERLTSEARISTPVVRTGESSYKSLLQVPPTWLQFLAIVHNPEGKDPEKLKEFATAGKISGVCIHKAFEFALKKGHIGVCDVLVQLLKDEISEWGKVVWLFQIPTTNDTLWNETVVRLISRTRVTWKDIDENGNTLLHVAMKHNCVPGICYLLKQSLVVNLPDSNGKTAVQLYQSLDPSIKAKLVEDIPFGFNFDIPAVSETVPEYLTESESSLTISSNSQGILVGTYKCGNGLWLFIGKIFPNQSIVYKKFQFICIGERSSICINNANEVLLATENNNNTNFQFGHIRNFEITWLNESTINNCNSPAVCMNDHSCFVIIFTRKDKLYITGGKNFKGKIYLSSAETPYGPGKDAKILLDNDGSTYTIHQSENFLHLYFSTGTFNSATCETVLASTNKYSHVSPQVWPLQDQIMF